MRSDALASPATIQEATITETDVRRHDRRIVRVAVVLAVACLGALAIAASPASAAQPCWKAIINDWIRHPGHIQGTYPINCYSQAIDHLNQLPDVELYSSAGDDIHRALLAALAARNGGGPGRGDSGDNNSSSSGGAAAVPPSSGGDDGNRSTQSVEPQPGGNSDGLITKAMKRLGPSNASSVPLPLLVLAGIAFALLLTAGGSFLARRIQARRMQPAPAPVRSSDSQ
jgi:hypothetical protein